MNRSYFQRRIPALALSALLLLALGGLPTVRAVAATPPAVASIGLGDLTVRIESLTPLVPTEKSKLRLRGLVTNVSDTTVRQAAVALRVSPTPLISRGEIAAVLSGQTSREGVRIAGTTSIVASALEPGESVEFSVEAPMSVLPLPAAGAYVVAAEALGDSGSGLSRQALDRSFLGWWPSGTKAERIGVTMLWPLSELPDRDATGTFLSDRLGLAVSSTGRLSNLVAAGAEQPGKVTWLVDPQVLQAAQEMSSGYQQYESLTSRTRVAGTRASEADNWLGEVREALGATQANSVASLYGTPDLDAARGGRALSNLLSQRAAVDEATEEIVGEPLPGEIAFAPTGNLNADTINQLVVGGVESVVLSELAYPTLTPLNYTPNGALKLSVQGDPLSVLLTDVGLSDTLGMPAASRADSVALRQRLVAETIVAALERPAMPRVIGAAPAVDWAPSLRAARAVVTVLDKAPWIKAVPLSAALASAVDSTADPARVHNPPTAEQQADNLPAEYVTAVRANQRGVTAYRRLVVNAQDVPVALQQAPSRQLSSWLRSDQETREQLGKLVKRQVKEVRNSVDVISTGVVTISGQAGTIPVTVANRGELPVLVGLELSSNPPLLFQADPVPAFQIGPGRRTSVEVPAQIAGSGNIPVEIRVITASGSAVGEPTELVVKSAAYAQAARWIIQFSLILLVVAVIVHGVRRARRMSAAAPRSDS